MTPQFITLLIGIPAALLCLALRPIYALCIYCTVIFAYPQQAVIPIGSVDFTTGRLAILALSLSIILRSGGRFPFRWRALDTWAVLAFGFAIISYLNNVPLHAVIEREGGVFLDSLLPYFVIRATLLSKRDLFILIRGLTYLGLPMALLGVIQAQTGINLMEFITGKTGWEIVRNTDPTMMRHGFHRATGSMGIIIFGLWFAGVAPLTLGLLGYRQYSKPLLLLSVAALLLGMASSMSSAPYMASVLAIMFICCFPLRRFWQPMALVVLAGYIFIEVFSNQGIFGVMTRFSFNPATAYYRIGLMNECFGGGMNGHWLFGYGYVGSGPGNDNTNFFWFHKDMVNIYIGKLARTGLVGTIPFIIQNGLYYFSLYVAARRTRAIADQWLIWCVAATLLSWNITMMTVNAFNQIETMLYMLIAIAASLPHLVTEAHPALSARQLWILQRLRLLQTLSRLRASHG